MLKRLIRSKEDMDGGKSLYKVPVWRLMWKLENIGILKGSTLNWTTKGFERLKDEDNSGGHEV